MEEAGQGAFVSAGEGPWGTAERPSHTGCVSAIPTPGKTAARPSQLMWDLAGPKVPGPWARLPRPQKQTFCALVRTLTVQSPQRTTLTGGRVALFSSFPEKEAQRGWNWIKVSQSQG